MKKLLLTLLVGLPAAMVADLGEHHGAGYVLKDADTSAVTAKEDVSALDLAVSDTLEDLSKVSPEDIKTLTPAELRVQLINK